MRTGVRLGIDVGDVRIGIARSDPAGTLAVPVEVVRRGTGDLDRIAALIGEHAAIEAYVGLPLSLNGREGPAAGKARAFADDLAARLAGEGAPTVVRLVDERLSTVAAARQMRSAGISSARGRSRVDAVAAAVIVQTALDHERSTGRPVGTIVSTGSR